MRKYNKILIYSEHIQKNPKHQQDKNKITMQLKKKKQYTPMTTTF